MVFQPSFQQVQQAILGEAGFPLLGPDFLEGKNEARVVRIEAGVNLWTVMQKYHEHGYILKPMRKFVNYARLFAIHNEVDGNTSMKETYRLAQFVIAVHRVSYDDETLAKMLEGMRTEYPIPERVQA